MTAQEAITYIHSYAAKGAQPDLAPLRRLLCMLGNPESSLRFVHIAGTNGKGSTAAMLSSVCRAAGYRTGLYTSPFIHVFNERMQVNGQPIGDGALGAAVEKVRRFAEDVPGQNEFAFLTAVALEWFCAERCDIVIWETGLGGRLDPTNVIQSPLVAVITNIGLEHTAELGDTIELIAREKAGIIKPGCDVVLYPQSAQVTDIIRAACEKKHAALYVPDLKQLSAIQSDLSGQVFSYKKLHELHLPLLGGHQLCNAAVALEALSLLGKKGYTITPEAILRGMADVTWPGRFEVLHRHPVVIVDGGHNPQGAASLSESLRAYFPNQKAVFVVGALQGKDHAAIFRAVAPHAQCFIAVEPPSGRALQKEELAAQLACFGLPVRTAASVEDGIIGALQDAGPDGILVIFGSLYMVAPAREYFLKANAR